MKENTNTFEQTLKTIFMKHHHDDEIYDNLYHLVIENKDVNLFFKQEADWWAIFERARINEKIDLMKLIIENTNFIKWFNIKLLKKEISEKIQSFGNLKFIFSGKRTDLPSLNGYVWCMQIKEIRRLFKPKEMNDLIARSILSQSFILIDEVTKHHDCVNQLDSDFLMEELKIINSQILNQEEYVSVKYINDISYRVLPLFNEENQYEFLLGLLLIASLQDCYFSAYVNKKEFSTVLEKYIEKDINLIYKDIKKSIKTIKKKLCWEKIDKKTQKNIMALLDNRKILKMSNVFTTEEISKHITQFVPMILSQVRMRTLDDLLEQKKGVISPKNKI